MRRVVLGCIPVLLAVAANAWILGLSFQADDFLLIPRAGAMLGIERGSLADESPGATALNFYLFRPVTWFLWWLLVGLSGGIAHAFVFHAAGLAGHVVATWLLWRILAGVNLAPFAAVAGASLFAIAPGAVQATSWVSAGGDQLATLFMLAATLLFQRDRVSVGGAPALGAGVCAALAFCSKEIAVASVPFVLLMVLPAPAVTSRRT